MKAIIKEKELGKHYYILSGGKGFLQRYCDSGFKSKWTGLWENDLKIIEYFAFKAIEEEREEWLGEKNCKKIEYNGAKAVHYFELENGEKIKQSLLMPEHSSALQIEMESEREREYEFEVAVNIRKREENFTERKYEVKKIGNTVEVGNELGKARIETANCSMDFLPQESYKTHNPGGEKESCFIPGKIKINGSKFYITMFCGRENQAIESFEEELKIKEALYEKTVNGLIESDNEALVKGFNWGVLGLKLLENNDLYYAGYPWFLQYWGRDLLWSIPAFLELGYFEKAKTILRTLAGKAAEGRIPNFLAAGEESFNSIDASLLYLISLEKYVQFSGDKNFIAENSATFLRALNFVRKQDFDKDLFIEHDFKENETWMDSYNRKDKGIEIQSLYIKALEASAKLLHFTGSHALHKELEKETKELRKLLEEKFFVPERRFYADRIIAGQRDSVKTSNVLVPLMLGQLKHREIIKEFESESFSCKKGIRTRARGEMDYAPNAYHKGQAWSLTTAWMSMAEFTQGNAGKGWNYAKILIEDLEEDCIGGIGESWNSESFKLEGCGMQLWAHSLLTQIIDEFLLGIKVDAAKKMVLIKPQFPEGMNYIKRWKRIGREWTEIEIKKTRKEDYLVKGSNKKIKAKLIEG
ncbi:MAG: amylo-alpha-1,6-glucosidase [Candidatus Diapherotrites archaeon]